MSAPAGALDLVPPGVPAVALDTAVLRYLPLGRRQAFAEHCLPGWAERLG